MNSFSAIGPSINLLLNKLKTLRFYNTKLKLRLPRQIAVRHSTIGHPAALDGLDMGWRTSVRKMTRASSWDYLSER